MAPNSGGSRGEFSGSADISKNSVGVPRVKSTPDSCLGSLQSLTGGTHGPERMYCQLKDYNWPKETEESMAWEVMVCLPEKHAPAGQPCFTQQNPECSEP